MKPTYSEVWGWESRISSSLRAVRISELRKLWRSVVTAIPQKRWRATGLQKTPYFLERGSHPPLYKTRNTLRHSKLEINWMQRTPRAVESDANHPNCELTALSASIVYTQPDDNCLI